MKKICALTYKCDNEVNYLTWIFGWACYIFIMYINICINKEYTYLGQDC